MMPIGRVKIVVRPASAVTRTQFRALVEGDLALRPVQRRAIDWTNDPDSRMTILDIEFQTPAAARGFRQWFADNVSTLRSLVNGTVTFCLCSHADAVVVPCSDAVRSEYREVRL